MTKTVIPTKPSELEEMLADTGKIENLMKEGQFGEFVTNYARTVINKDKELGTQIKEQTQLAVAEMFGADKNADGVKRLNMALHKQPQSFFGGRGVYNQNAPGAKLDNEFASGAEFFQAIWHKRASLGNSAELERKVSNLQKIQNSYGSTVGADGGFLVPEVMRSELLSVSLEESVVRSRARVIPMETLRVSLPMVDTTSNASSVFGGVVCYWTEEGATLTESQATFGRVALEAKKLTAYAEAPNELVSDASAFGAFLGQTLPQALAWYEDDAFIDGNGAGMPQGFLNGAAVVAVTKESGQAADTIVWENIVKMYSRMLPSSLGRAVWVAHIDTFPELATMALSVGTGGSAIWLNNGQVGPPMTILGRPVIFTEKAETVGDQGDINFVDLGYYLIGDRQVMQADSSPHFKFSSDKTAYRVISRVDGRPWIQSAITPKTGSNTLTPFVSLAARA